MKIIEEKTKNIILESQLEFERFLLSANYEKFRASQIKKWIFDKFVTSFDKMQNIPRNLQKILAKHYHITSAIIENGAQDTNDLTKKILLRFADGISLENAIIRAPNRLTFCLSTQCGCPVACLFCASGKFSFKRNLSTEEIIDEFILCANISGRKPDNIVIMGVGEPLMNLQNLSQALDLISSPNAFALSPRRITISTSGYVPGIRELAYKKRQWNLAISLHAPDDSIRKKIIPNLNYSISEIISAANYYKKSNGRIVTIEYVLIDNLNSEKKHAEKLAKIAKLNKMKVNLIPLNTHKLSDFKRPSSEKIKEFEKILKQYKIPVTIRMEKGGNINAACGQLSASIK